METNLPCPIVTDFPGTHWYSVRLVETVVQFSWVIRIDSTYIVSNISKIVKYIRDALDNTYWFKILSYFTMARYARLGENSSKNGRRKIFWRKICSRIEEWSYLSLLTEYLQFLCLSLATILVSPPHYSLCHCLEFYLIPATKISGHNCECLIFNVSSAGYKVELFFNAKPSSGIYQSLYSN